MKPKKTDAWAPDQWLQADTRMLTGETQGECNSRKQQENRYWDRTMFVPEKKYGCKKEIRASGLDHKHV